jgi:GH15 family glucan-1,4-alpha-glucosidase
MAINNKYEPIQNYGIIGNLHTVALVSLKGSIDFMSFPRFDSPTIFAKLLDAGKGGSFSIQPAYDDTTYKQLYFPDTTILITRFFSNEGIAELIDFMPLQKFEADCSVIRKIKVIRGRIEFNMKCSPRFNYAKEIPTIKRIDNGLLFESTGKQNLAVSLISDVPLKYNKNGAYANFILEEKQSAYFILSQFPDTDNNIQPIRDYIKHNLRVTKSYWKNWISKCRYRGRWREIVYRSALTLKLLTSWQFGSVIAAATFGLPEIIGGVRNWDYRYTWTRDAAFTMYAFLRLGFLEEAAAYISWIAKLSHTGQMQVMYSMDGHTNLKEHDLKYLDGYKGTKPVRVGNAAHQQFQLDIYGELIDTIYLYNKDGGAITYDLWQEIVRQVNFVVENWQRPDHGIWEIRRRKKEFLHSRMMCWVAIDRAIKIAEDRSFPYPFNEWRQVRDQIYNDIYENFWNEEKQAYVQHKNSKELDAAVLLMPLMRLVSPSEERWKKTMLAVEKELKSDVLIYRYRGKDVQKDGIGGEEGTFTMCSFWYVECLSKSGQTEKAAEYFEKMLGYANHLGLFSEQLGSRGEHLGNFPQAFTHLALISAAFQLDSDLDKKAGQKNQ